MRILRSRALQRPAGLGSASHPSLCLSAALVLAVAASPALCRMSGQESQEPAESAPPGVLESQLGVGLRDDPPETLWIFDADFEDLLGDNAGWQSFDLSDGNVGGDYWHKDTIRINGFAHLGDSTWWCGTYHPAWWRQDRGYGNDWMQWLYREMPLSEWSESGDDVTFEYDQRYAMELSYDYGYTDVSTDGGETWTTLWTQTNAGFVGTPGMSQNWNSTHPNGGGQITLDLSEFAGLDISVRYRFESDGAYSSQDQYDNSSHSVLDGAWQLDNFCFEVNGDVVWLDDCESPGENGWIHQHAPIVGGTGVRFERTFEPDTYRGHTCDAGTGWMMAAVDLVTGRMVDLQHSLLMTPPIDVSGLDGVIVQWDMWHDFPYDSQDHFSWGAARNDTCTGLDQQACFTRPSYRYPRWYQQIGGSLEGPGWTTVAHDLSSSYVSEGWMALGWWVYNYNPVPPDEHLPGAFLERVRVGVRSDDSRTVWNVHPNELWTDSFSVEEIAGRQLWLTVGDSDGLEAVRTVASNDSGSTWHSYDFWSDSFDQWCINLPQDLLAPATQVLYYFEATDNHGNTSVYPEQAPDDLLEFTILPIHGSEVDPGILVVDKRRARTPGDDRRYGHDSEYYLTEALDILGFEYDVYDAYGGYDAWSWIPARGPYQPEAYSHYDTHIWLIGDVVKWTVEHYDQFYLIDWLSTSTLESPHRLFLYGNNIGWDLIEKENENSGFFTDWLGASYEDYHAGAHLRSDVPDTSIRVRDAGLGLMTHDDGECWLRCGCPDLQYLDVVSPAPGSGAQPALEYVNGLCEVRPAGVVKVDSVLGYRVVYLPFGIELMHDGLDGTGHYANGIEDRVDLVANVMEFLGETPTVPGTGTPDDSALANRLSHARPNPFNPRTTIEYSVAARGRVTLLVYDLAGRVVRTLVDRDVEPGEHKVVWDGTTDTGKRAASGVYFVKMETEGPAGAFREVRKAVLLK